LRPPLTGLSLKLKPTNEKQFATALRYNRVQWQVYKLALIWSLCHRLGHA